MVDRGPLSPMGRDPFFHRIKIAPLSSPLLRVRMQLTYATHFPLGYVKQ